MDKKEKAAKIIQSNMKKYLLPFINRVTANIYDRIIYYKKIIKYLKFNKNKKNYCVKFYKFNKYNKPIFRIGNNIILKNEIGSGSSHGAIYLSSFRDINKKLFKYVIKISPISYKTFTEIKINEIVSNAVIKNLCPHFPISYGYALCMKNNLSNSSYIKSKESQNSQEKPEFFLNKKNYYIYLNELASGDLKTFNLNITLNKNKQILDNKIAQIYLSLMFFYKETGCYHCDAYDKNFLYHKIKKGGYYHYNIFNQDYYLPNLGYLWIIWDYEHAKSLSEPISNHKIKLTIDYDFYTITNYLISNYNIYDIKLINKKIFIDFFNSSKNAVYEKKLFHKFLQTILDCLSDLKYIYKNIDKSSIIINPKPYVITEISPM